MLKAIILLVIVGTALCEYKAAPYASWAHSHWVWQNGGTQTQASLEDMVAQYTKRGIPVGALNIDSDWTTSINNFIWNTSKFPSPKNLINRMHQQNIRVIAWVTSVINTDATNYAEAKEKGYLLNQGAPIKWWHGHGAFLDYHNKEAVNWWHKQLDPVLDLGLDGWKCDGTDPLLILLRPWPYSGTKKTNFVSYREYATSYYGDFYNYTNSKRPGSLIMSRPVDNLLDKYYISYSPKYVMFSGWVGDQDSTYDGMRSALKNMFHSAWKGYLNFGCDIGGYRDKKITKEVFIRYVQLGAMVPLMENGGNGKHFPWLFDEETVDIYRKFATLHTDLTPYFLTSATEAYPKGVSVMKPLATKQGKWAPHDPDSWGYLLGKEFLIYPVTNDAGIAVVEFPAGDWVYYFNETKVFKGKSKIEAMFPLNEFPVFMKKGVVIPFNGKYLMVYPEGQENRTIYHGDWSD